MKLYGAIASPYVTRVLMFARLKGIELQLENAPGGPRSEDYRAINPIGKIPALEVDGQTIAESEVICEFLEELQPEPSAMCGNPLDNARSRMVSRITDLYLAPHASTMVRQVNPEKRDPAIVAEAAGQFASAFGYLEHFMGAGPFAVGDSPSLGDCAAGPYVMLLKKLVFENFEQIPDPTLGSGRLADWWQALESNAVCSATIDEYAMAVDGFLKYLIQKAAS